ncbi:MAG: LemA family protein [Bacteroidales bacterium]|nr:LemA family protein [Bacteroidales bacterium]
MIAVYIILGVLVLWLALSYNGLVGKRNEADKAFASIDTMAKKRYDLIPNLVATVQQYMQHERQTLTDITEMRARATSGNLSDEEKIELDSKISKAVSGIMVAVENYPDLKASNNFMQLQGSLNEVEEQLSAARRFYNAAVTDYNNAVQMVPSNIIASMFNFKLKKLFEISEKERQNVDVKSLFKS